MHSPDTCVSSADDAQFLNRAIAKVSSSNVPPEIVAALSMAFVALVLLASLTTSLTLRLPLIHYKQRRSRVSSSRFHPLQVSCTAPFPRCTTGRGALV